MAFDLSFLKSMRMSLCQGQLVDRVMTGPQQGMSSVWETPVVMEFVVWGGLQQSSRDTGALQRKASVF